jgi:hypothetical protein
MIAARPAKEQLWMPFAASLIGAPIAGGLFALLRGAPLVLIPAAVGMWASFLLILALWQGQLHDRVLGIALAVLFVIMIYLCYHLISYLSFRADQARLYQDILSVSPTEAAQLVEDDLANETGAGGIVGYYRLVLNTGYRLTSPMPLNNQQVSGLGVMAYWGIDVLLLSIVILTAVWNALQRPFCATCGRYYGHFDLNTGRSGLDRLGRMDAKAGVEFIRLLKADHLDQAGTLLQEGKIKPSDTDVLLERCPSCDTNPIVLYVFRKANQRSATLIKPLTRAQYYQLTTFMSVDSPQSAGRMRQWATSVLIVAGFITGILFAIARLSRL